MLPTDQVLAQTRRIVGGLDANLPLEDIGTLDDTIPQNTRTQRLILQLSGAFAVLATALAMLGLYGVMAFSVARRTREIGIRLASARIRRRFACSSCARCSGFSQSDSASASPGARAQ